MKSKQVKVWLAVVLLLGLGLTSMIVLAAGFSTSQKTAFNTGAGHVEPTEWPTVSWNPGYWSWEVNPQEVLGTATPSAKVGAGGGSGLSGFQFC